MLVDEQLPIGGSTVDRAALSRGAGRAIGLHCITESRKTVDGKSIIS